MPPLWAAWRLVWDYVIWNEITFVDAETGSHQSLFTSISDSATAAEFNRLTKLYGSKGESERIQIKSGSSSTEDEIFEKIKKVKELYDNGIIEKEEFEKKKKQLLDKI